MAILYSIPLHGSAAGCMRYISAQDKIIPQEDTMRLMTYMQSHGAEEAVSVGYNGCCGSRDIALEQFRACERLYHGSHNAKHQGVVAHHFIFSLAEGEKADLYQIWREMMQLPELRSFYGYANVHYNTDALHLHVAVSNYSKTGNKKLGMKKSNLYKLRHELDRICVRHGLSIIDDPVLMVKYPEREAWIEDLVRSGAVRVLLPSNALRIKRPSRHLRWMIAQYHAGRVGICKGESFQGKFEQPTKQAKQIAIHAARAAKKEAYAVRTPGRKLSLDEQLRRAQSQKVREIQAMLDSMSICREMNVTAPPELEQRIKEIGDCIGRTDRSLVYQRRIASETISVADPCQDTRKRQKAAERVSALEKKRAELSRQYRDAMRAKKSIEMTQYRMMRT